MSAGVCGKRAGFDDIFGSPSPQGPSAKRSRCCSPSQTRCSDLGFGSEDKLSVLFRMFPSIDRRVVESILESHDNKIDDAIKNLHALCLCNDREAGEAVSLNVAVLSNDNAVQDMAGGTSNLSTEETALHIQHENSENSRMFQNGTTWVDLFVQEMTKASGWDDVRGRTTKLLESFENNVIANSMASKEEEIVLLKDQVQCMLKDNNILKKGIQIQHERNLEQEEKLKEVPQLKHFISQCQEQIRKLEMDNYTLRIYLQRAQEANSMSSHYNRDIF